MNNAKIIDVTPAIKQDKKAQQNAYFSDKGDIIESPETSGYEEKYDEDSFWDKTTKYAKALGCEGIEKALQLYYVLDNPELPTKTKVIIYGALGYFISPVDLIPDTTPLVGFTDDMAALVATVALVSSFINTNVKAKAHTELEGWFGKEGCEDE